MTNLNAEKKSLVRKTCEAFIYKPKKSEREGKIMKTNQRRVIDITIPIKPVPKARPRFAGHQVFTPSKTHAAENTIAVLVLNKMKLSGMQMIATGPVKVTAEFFFKTAEKRKHETAKSSRPDVDNLGKTVLDALNGVAFKDDGQVSEFNCSKRYAEQDSIRLVIEELSAA